MECHNKLEEALGNNVLPYRRTVARSVGKFQQGRVSTSDNQRSGRLVSVWIYLTRAVIEQVMDEDRRWTLLELERVSGIEKRTFHRILRKHLRKIKARRVPHALTEVQRWSSWCDRYDVVFGINVRILWTVQKSCTKMQDHINQSACGSYYDIGNLRNCSTLRILPTIRFATLISFPRLRNQYVVDSLQHTRGHCQCSAPTADPIYTWWGKC
ncbi:histone-lysine N-methyltransferase SETMAR [Trichonephila clavata]|uniref:Histone-lysine N-methyltransferase SETMAR n=1 Tax=Trichonephila clavata TaxID=2740835 RepID=A0A8X6EWB3_TRICU|nr:histone-lysine N-methyltransferase SETMAR [Trichonephila clavata]